MANVQTAENRLAKAVADLLRSRNNNLYAKAGYYDGDGQVTIGDTVYPAFCAIDTTLYKGKRVICVFNASQTKAYIVGD